MVKCENFRPKIIAKPIDKTEPIPKEDYLRRTHYYTQEILDWIDTMAYFEKMDKSEIIRKALESYIPEKYKIKR